MAQPTLWERVRGGSKKSFDVAWKAVDKIGAPTNRLTNKLGSEAFWPTSLDKESDKAARILKSFCKDGFYAETRDPAAEGPTAKQKVLKKIPAEVIQNAKGLAIFTTMRMGLWFSGAGGSGILMARLPDGSWSPPSGILLHTAGLGFLVGVDIYDCVVVINSEKALEAFSKVRVTLGSEVSVAAGPFGAGGVLESEVHKRQSPIFTYLKSRGFYAGVQIDGTIIIERTDENEKFYGERIGVGDILAGKIRHPPTYDYRRLTETLKAAQGDTNFDASALPDEPPPGDYQVEEDGKVFGVPERDDPDPYGVLALEKEGMSLKEAGTQKRASWQEFHFNPSPTSPVQAVFNRSSQDRGRNSGSQRNSWRASAISRDIKSPTGSRPSVDLNRPSMVSSSTQTEKVDASESLSVRSGASERSSRGSLANTPSLAMQRLPEDEVLETQADEQQSTSKVHGYNTPPGTPPPMEEKKAEALSTQDVASSPSEKQNVDEDLDHDHDDDDADDDHDDEDEDVQIIEPPVYHSVQAVQAAKPVVQNVNTKAKVVNVGKRPPPPMLPPRNPNRAGASRSGDVSPARVSPSTSPAAHPVADKPSEDKRSAVEPAESKHDSANTPAGAYGVSSNPWQ